MRASPRRSCPALTAWTAFILTLISVSELRGQAPTPDVKATLTDNTAAATKKNPGDTINYEMTVTNASTATASASNPTMTLPTPAGTTIVAGSVNVSPLVFDESYTVLPNCQTVVDL